MLAVVKMVKYFYTLNFLLGNYLHQRTDIIAVSSNGIIS